MAGQATVSVAAFDQLYAAAEGGEIEKCRGALAEFIDAHGGELDSKFMAYKASRAEDFRTDAGRVVFVIERHPGASWLTHRMQTWRIGPERIEFEDGEPKPLDIDTLVRRAARVSPDGNLDAARGEVCAVVDFANAVERDGDIERWREQVALGWVCLALYHAPLSGRWPGRLSDVDGVDYSAGHGYRFDRDDARSINEIAQAAWQQVMEGVKVQRHGT
jgi:hypothetical protein